MSDERRERVAEIVRTEWVWSDNDDVRRALTCPSCGDVVWYGVEDRDVCLNCWKTDAILAALGEESPKSS